MTAREPGSPLRRGVAELVEEAGKRITTLSLDEAAELLDDPDVLFVDIRDPRELQRDGMIPGAFRAPRGMLEFWVDPASPYYKPELDSGKRLVLYCAGALRSSLATATLVDMGVDNVAHIEGGYGAWKKAGHPTVEV